MNIEKFQIDSFGYLVPESLRQPIHQFDTIHLNGCAGSYDVLLLCYLYTTRQNSLFVFVANSKEAEILFRQCASFIGEEAVSLFPSRDAIPYNMKSPFGPTIEARFRVLSQLMNNEKKIYIAPSTTLIQKIIPQRELFNSVIRLSVNDEISLEKLSFWLSNNGFERETTVQDIGTYAIRGGIMDIYPFLEENPIRLEFWGDCIESIREFDIFKQNSLLPKNSVQIFPMKEFLCSENDINKVLQEIDLFCKEKNTFFKEALKLKQTWKSNQDHNGIEWFIHWFNRPYETILDYLPVDCCIVWNDYFNCKQRLNEHFNNYKTHINRVPETFLPFVTVPESLLIPEDIISEDMETYKKIYINTESIDKQGTIEQLQVKEQPIFNSTISLLIADLIEKEKNGFSPIILCENTGHGQRLRELIESDSPATTIKIGYLERGFIDNISKTALYSENQIFKYAKRSIRNKRIKSGSPLKNYDSLLPGDFVVHLDHGIAQFLGIEPIRTTGIHQDCMVLKYQNNATVYVPIQDFHKVQKYIGKDSTNPLLSQLGTARWEKQKQKTRECLKEMAQNLIKLYAKREFFDGIQFPKDSVWQKEFEDSFMYDLTPDQHKAIIDVKKDMEILKPMDRLVCGDVGFGKTEIAMRAAFKAANSGYQVAILAPTTILAAQHYATFSERISNFPIKVAVLSRFQKSKEQKIIVKELKAGTVDIVIGTHRILSKDVEFKELGLLIIDEEQHFGVRSKEKLKELRFKVDVLSLTATPIPRTMHMSLIGIRDLSIINTPPKNRLPIETHVAQYHEGILKTAIENELDRGGQVYVVHNRIKGLSLLQDTIELSVPRARIIIAHGQMDEKELEMVMKEFVAGKYDVLLSTAIIESGLDIPNVNTIIVTRADIMGLSQLYQLRGRVGRSSEQAFAYFLTHSFEQIKPISLKRLRALEQYTDLGSGFQIAMRDLEIRGAGNLLGTYQHGFIAAIGFELYSQLLKEEIDKINGKIVHIEKMEVKIDIPVDAYIPNDYIPDSSSRISFYQECSACDSMEAIEDLQKSFIDRFGPIPEPVKILLILIQIKILGQELFISHLNLKEDICLTISFHGSDEEVAQRIKKVLSLTQQNIKVVYGKPILLKTDIHAKGKLPVMYEILTMLKTMLRIEK